MTDSNSTPTQLRQPIPWLRLVGILLVVLLTLGNAAAAEGDRCRVEIARELSRALVFDGRSAVAYVDDYERRCGDDPIVRRWANASRRRRW